MNLIDLLFIALTFFVVVLGTLVTSIEKYLPDAIKQSFRYGKHAHTGQQDKLVSLLELPKSWFKHFYVFAFAWTWLAVYLAVDVYFLGNRPHQFVLSFLDLSCGSDRSAETSPFLTLTALGLMTIQITRRFIESNFLQIFSKTSKINLSHYLCGYLHYYGVIILIVAKGDGFVFVHTINEIEFQIQEVIVAVVCSILFLYFWYKQYSSNMIFINLRKNKNGKVTSEKHLVPKGGLFKYVSSPHMTCEITMYSILYILLNQNTSFIYCLIWVLTNQMANAILTHKWYKKTFADYPTDRKAIIPFLL
ncbi:unnamed protein product [Diamesa serratosioi]